MIEPLIRGSVDAVRQHCPAKRLTPMGLLRVEVRRNDVILSGGWVHEQMRGRGDALIYKGGRVGSMWFLVEKYLIHNCLWLQWGIGGQGCVGII